MNILIIGPELRKKELIRILHADLEISYEKDLRLILLNNELNNFDLIIDTNLDDDPGRLQDYAGLIDKWILVCSVKKALKQMAALSKVPVKCKLVGMNLLPGFIERTKQEISFFDEKNKDEFLNFSKQLVWKSEIVKDEIGMVTPRVICMIINEACYTLERGTATIADIDKGMKLGTAYPFGPFAWCNRIGIKEVYETLLALYENKKDERYAICPLLKDYYERGAKFLN